MDGDCTTIPELLDWDIVELFRDRMILTLNFSSPLSVSSSEVKDKIYIVILNP